MRILLIGGGKSGKSTMAQRLAAALSGDAPRYYWATMTPHDDEDLARIRRHVADRALQALEIDQLGLDNIDRRMLTSIIENYAGGPVGLDTLAATVGEEAVTIEEVCEPYLLQIGFLNRTPRGRCATKLAYEHLGMEFPAVSSAQLSLDGETSR